MPISTTNDRANFRAWITLTHGRIRPLNINLEEIPAGVLKGCWVINHLWFDYTSPRKPEPPNRPPDPAPQVPQPNGVIPVSP